MRRFHVPPAAWSAAEVQLPEELVRHLQVLRLSPGAECVLWDGAGNCVQCRLLELGRRGGRAEILRRWREKDSAYPVHLLQGLPKSDKFEWVLQKGTELGLARITPVVSERSVPQLAGERADNRLQRWRRITEEAARQCGRCTLPAVDGPQSLAQSLAGCDAGLRLLLWEEGSLPLVNALPASPPPSACVLVGPEGGLSASEAELAAGHGFLPIRLGPRILRTETAGVAILSVLQYVYGDIGHGDGLAVVTSGRERE